MLDWCIDEKQLEYDMFLLKLQKGNKWAIQGGNSVPDNATGCLCQIASWHSFFPLFFAVLKTIFPDVAVGYEESRVNLHIDYGTIYSLISLLLFVFHLFNVFSF